MPPGSISPALTLVLARGQTSLGQRSPCSLARFPKNCRRDKKPRSRTRALYRGTQSRTRRLCASTHRRAEKGSDNGEAAHHCAALRPWPVDHRHVLVQGARQSWPRLRSASRVALCERIYLSFRFCLNPPPLTQKADRASKDYYDRAVWMLAL